jgi:hypothetical protein
MAMKTIRDHLTPDYWSELQPFGEILDKLVIPAALTLMWSGQIIQPPKEFLEELSRQISDRLSSQETVSELKTCCGAYKRAVDRIDDPEDKETHLRELDGAYSVLCLLERWRRSNIPLLM